METKSGGSRFSSVRIVCSRRPLQGAPALPHIWARRIKHARRTKTSLHWTSVISGVVAVRLAVMMPMTAQPRMTLSLFAYVAALCAVNGHWAEALSGLHVGGFIGGSFALSKSVGKEALAERRFGGAIPHI
jgi:hypothetical protein